MKVMAAALVAIATVLAGSGTTYAQQRYPDSFNANVGKHCVERCSTNANIRGREASCPAFCQCVVEESQRQLPLEVALEAERNVNANQMDTPAVQRWRTVARECARRSFPAPSPAR